MVGTKRVLMPLALVARSMAAQMPANFHMVHTEKDRMTGKQTAIAIWTAIDSIHSQYSYLPILTARCTEKGNIDVFLSGVPVSPGSPDWHVKIDGWDKPRGMGRWGHVTADDHNNIWWTSGKHAISDLLLKTDTLLLRFPTLFGTEVTPEFHLGPRDSVRAALKTIADACDWELPQDEK